MGMQINYWMEYEKFCELAETALSLGCIILKHDLDNGKVVQSRDISIVTCEIDKLKRTKINKRGILRLKKHIENKKEL